MITRCKNFDVKEDSSRKTEVQSMEDVKIITIAELVQRPRPLTGTASLHLPSTRSIPHSYSSLSTPTTTTPTSNRNPRVLTPLSQPTILVGTLTLPILNASSPARCTCFQFSDGSSTVCCDILGFDARVIGKEIRVYAWNFIPFNPESGYLEIIKWGFPDSSDDHLNHVGSFPLVPGDSSTADDSSRARHRVNGVIYSVGSVFVVPLMKGASDSKLTGDSNSSSSQTLQGFLAQVICCECRLCDSKVVLTDLSGSMANEDSHSFTKLEFVYFCGDDASSWHTVITKLSGNHIMLSGLKKKMIFIEKELSRVMYVTTNKSILHVCRFSKKRIPCLKMDDKGRDKFGSYTGIVRDVYMQGMVVELDSDVWLLLTDQLLTLPHGLRVGAIISVRNVHFVAPKFSWTQILILGACVKTSIVVKSFSPLETLCHVVSRSQSMLGKFVQSLPFSARLWALLIVSSLRKKFGLILSDKELLGSKHKEGLAQTFARSQLPSSVFQTRHGALMEMCRHDSYSCGRELHCGILKLVLPMSVFIGHCIATLMRKLKSGNGCELLPVENHWRLLSCKARSYARSVRRIIPSKIVGSILIGNLMIDPSSGRLQLVDATGGIDVIIPDLPLNWDFNKLYEVMEYNIVVDGIPQLVDHLELCESLSCRTIFNCTRMTRESNILIYVQFLWKNVKCRYFPAYPSISRKNDSDLLEPGTYHLLRVSHKFPLLEKLSMKSSTFVEAMLLPWILFIPGESGILHPSKVSRGQIMELSEYRISGKCEEQVSNKRHKLVKETRSSLLKDEFGNSICELSACSNSFNKSEETKNCIDLSSSHQIPCLVTLSIQNENVLSSAILHSTLPVVHMDVDSQPNARKILLEFLSESFLKHQLLQIGGYYIIKHHKKDCFCTLKDVKCGSSFKVLVDSGKHLWSLSFVSCDVLLNLRSTYSSAQDNLSPSIEGFLPEDQIEQLILRSNIDTSGICSDVCICLPANLKDLLEDNILKSEQRQGQLSAISEESVNVSQSTRAAVAGLTPSAGSLGSNCLFAQENLISLQGDVIDSHDIGSNSSNSRLSCAGINALRLKGFVGSRSSLCIHVLVDHYIVKIFGSVNENAFPTGFGPGVSATFHRILDIRGQNEFMLLPVSFIVIKSIKAYDPYSNRFSNLWPITDAYEASLDSSSPGLISELNKCPSHKQMWLRCRVVALFVLFMQRNATTFDKQAKSNAMGTPFDIPLAGFVLDDGSSSCCCWANAERASTLLGLHEKLPERAFESRDQSLKWVVVGDNVPSTGNYHLGRILKKYQRITVKNYGSCNDSLNQDHVFSVTSGNVLSSSEENLLKFIIFNACVGRVWNVAARVMHAEEVRQMEKEYHIEMENLHAMQNIWANKICYMNFRSEARNLMQQLLQR